jgi:hypothetical protein
VLELCTAYDCSASTQTVRIGLPVVRVCEGRGSPDELWRMYLEAVQSKLTVGKRMELLLVVGLIGLVRGTGTARQPVRLLVFESSSDKMDIK